MGARAAISVVLAVAAGVAVVATITAAPRTTTQSWSTLNRFACYPGQFSAFRPQTLTIADSFSAWTKISILSPQSVCAPASGSATGFLTCYRVRATMTRFRPTTPRVSDEFSKTGFSVPLLRLETLCVPSARVDAAAANSTAKGLDLFVCYASGAEVTRSTVDVADVFGQSRDQIAQPYRLCASAARPGLKPLDPQRLLGCYSATSSTKGSTIILRNEYGYLKATLAPRLQVCTAATIAK